MSYPSCLIMIIGLPGTGKSYFARILSKSIGAHHINSDQIRHQFGLRGRYDESSKRRVYSALVKEAENLLKKDEKAVIVDATLYKKDLRLPYKDLANRMGVNIFWVEMTADESIIKERISKERPFSEADYDVYQKIKGSYEPLEERHLVLASDKLSNPEMISRALYYFFEL